VSDRSRSGSSSFSDLDLSALMATTAAIAIGTQHTAAARKNGIRYTPVNAWWIKQNAYQAYFNNVPNASFPSSNASGIQVFRYVCDGWLR
jgi:hypothetical protein